MDDHVFQIRMPCRIWSRRWLFLIGIVASLFLAFHSFTLPYRRASLPSLPSLEKEEILSTEATSYVMKRLGMLSLLSDTQNSTNPSVVPKGLDSAEKHGVSGRTDLDFRDKQVDVVSDQLSANNSDLTEDVDLNKEILLDAEDREKLQDAGVQVVWSISEGKTADLNDIASDGMAKEAGSDFAFTSQNAANLLSENNQVIQDQVIAPAKVALSSNTESMKEELAVNSSSHVAMSSALVFSLSEGEGHATDANLTVHHMMGTHLTNSTILPLSGGSASSTLDSKHNNIFSRSKKLGRRPVSVPEMKQLLLTYYSSNQQKKARRHSAHDKQLLAAKALLQKAAVTKNDEGLYGAAFWNISEFKRSYELMERLLKIYVYKEGNKPVFHQPLLRGIYASEGWLMKLLQTYKRFVVKDHRKANLFYLPFSSRLLQLSFYVRNSHSHRNLAQHLKNYVDIISEKYPYWNRTGGADHFLVACHDWAPHITGQAMETSIRALCNADLRKGFKLGKDVSLPEIYIRSAQNPLRDLGGNPANNRSILAFYAGNLHGRLRPILLQHWENKDPDMKILGPMPPGVESKMVYIQYMKTSKYCICPRGYEVNSPRIVESIYYECVPVIISDNYVPPFLEMLNWEAFSLIIPEEDVPRLKDILVAIPEDKYRLLQLGVRKVQQHFLWHSKPMKYDLFHMILHSIWYNRLHLVGSR